MDTQQIINQIFELLQIEQPPQLIHQLQRLQQLQVLPPPPLQQPKQLLQDALEKIQSILLLPQFNVTLDTVNNTISIASLEGQTVGPIQLIARPLNNPITAFRLAQQILGLGANIPPNFTFPAHIELLTAQNRSNLLIYALPNIAVKRAIISYADTKRLLDNFPYISVASLTEVEVEQPESD